MRDTYKERLLAALFGGFGTVAGLLVYQAVPDLIRHELLVLRIANAALFILVVFTIGCTGGFIGHWLFLNVPAGSPRSRATAVGAMTGLWIAAKGWVITWIFLDALFPFEPFEGMSDLMTIWLRNALVAGPLGGMIISLFITVTFIERDRGVRGE